MGRISKSLHLGCEDYRQGALSFFDSTSLEIRTVPRDWQNCQTSKIKFGNYAVPAFDALKLLFIFNQLRRIQSGMAFADLGRETRWTKKMGTMEKGNFMTRLTHRVLFLCFAFCSADALHQTLALDRVKARDQGRRLYQRIVGTSPSNQATEDMTNKLASGDVEGATFYAMRDRDFYKITIKQMFNILTSKDFNPDYELTDSTALAVGLIRDNQRFDQYLYGDVFYTASDAMQNFTGLTFTVPRGDPITQTAIVANQSLPFVSDSRLTHEEYGQKSPDATKITPLLDGQRGSRFNDNRHFSELESKYVDWPNLLVKRKQSDIWAATSNSKILPEDIAGVMTTRKVATEFYVAGTNRRMFRYAMLDYLCLDMQQLHDSSSFDDMVRADVDRRPGGELSTYKNTCKGCHAGMDAFTAAFSFLDYNISNLSMTYLTDQSPFSFGKTIDPANYPAFPYDSTRDNKQFRQASVFPDGFNPIKMQANKNNWANRWVTGANAQKIGWRVPEGMSTYAKGKGANELGRVLAATDAFSACMVRKVFQRVCFRSPSVEEARTLSTIQKEFERGFSEYSAEGAEGPYNMKSLFAKTANICFGH